MVAAIDHVVKMLSPHFHVPGMSREDVAQEGRLICLELVRSGKYDGQRPLPNFLFVHLRNRYRNLLRRIRRGDSPCDACHRGEPCGADGKVCEKYAVWWARQESKWKVASPMSYDPAAGEPKSAWEDDEATAGVEVGEILRRIDDNLPADLRGDWLRLKEGLSVGAFRRKAVEKALFGILTEAGLDPAELGITQGQVSWGRATPSSRNRAVPPDSPEVG